ncbi:MAG TPA: alanine racemase [Xanthobacteraceae bacterium]|nr:alanine racemase [Xanthobacteraceae bacterium]
MSQKAAARAKPEETEAAFGPGDAEAGGLLTIDLNALVANYRDLAARAKPAECAAVVKADAYGIGLEPAAAALAKTGCKTFFVALLDEALKLRTVAPDAAIYVLNGLNPGTASAFRDIDARPVLGSMAEIEEWDAAARTAKEPLAAAIHIDTGMSRHGLSADEAGALAAKLKALAFKPALVMSHLARADEAGQPMTAKQIADFKAHAAKFPGIAASLANSAGLLAHPDSRFDLVRPGISLYGGRALIAGDNPMRPVVRLDVKIIQVRQAKAGDTVGYGGEFKLARDSRLAVLSAGYADGIPRASGSTNAKPGMEAVIAGKRCPSVGRVSMDLVVVDVTDLPSGAVKRGEVATLLGEGISVDDLAASSGTVGYEILTRLGSRYRRTYIGG